MSLPARLTFVSGFFYYVYTALLIFFGPLLPVVMLTFLPERDHGCGTSSSCSRPS